MNFRRIVCFDLEMCCWNDGRNPSTGEIIEIGVAEIDLVSKEIVKRSQYYVTPEKDEISQYCIDLTHITPSIIRKQGRPLKDVLESMKANYGNTNKIYGAWGRDDLVLFNECKQKDIPLPFREYLNIATLYRIHHRDKNKRYGMRIAMEKAGLEFEGTQHSGYNDAYNLARLALTFL